MMTVGAPTPETRRISPVVRRISLACSPHVAAIRPYTSLYSTYGPLKWSKIFRTAPILSRTSHNPPSNHPNLSDSVLILSNSQQFTYNIPPTTTNPYNHYFYLPTTR